MKLPAFFEDSMKNLMSQAEYEAFKASFDEKRYSGFRVNTLKVQKDRISELLGKDLEPILWVPGGFYYPEGESLGKHPAYHAGLYYIQEPSAMMPAQILAPKPYEIVLDLCAAPGGKTTQLGTHMGNTGLLVTNDISPKRVKALVKNVELMGLTNAFIVNESPGRLAQIYPMFFDRILLDVPCSGEGMFRKDKEAVLSYTKFKSSECVSIQREIFDSAYSMLKPGGRLVYSTCTFNPDENERNIEYFIKKYDLSVESLDPKFGWEHSRSEWTFSGDESLNGGLRLWPHKGKGEGHFVCCLVKKGHSIESAPDSNETMDFTSKEAEEAFKSFNSFCNENMTITINGTFHMRGSSLYRLPTPMKEVPAIKWDKAGLYLGEYEKGRFEPSQSLIMASKPQDFKRIHEFKAGDQGIIRYLKGETLFADGEKGYTVVCMDEFPLGWAKQDSGMLKNLYPKGWRMM